MTAFELNLDDGATNAELTEFWRKYHRATRRVACELLGPRKDNVKVCHTLAAYAIAKVVARKARAEGNIQSALCYEKHCDLYYAQLPEDIRW